MVTETGSAGLVERLRAAAAGPGVRAGPGGRRPGRLALPAGPGSLEPELLRRPAGTPWVLTPLHRAPDSSWSVLVAVFAPGERAPVHDHGAWAVIGIVAGRERETRFRRGDTGLEWTGHRSTRAAW